MTDEFLQHIQMKILSIVKMASSNNSLKNSIKKK